MRFLALGLWLTTILWLSLTSHPPKVSGLLGWDKLQHAGAYGLLAFLSARFLVQARGRIDGTWSRTAAFTIGFGILLELLQMISGTGRAGEWGDLLADALGVITVCVVFRHAVQRRWVQPIHFETDHG
jgi:VanZ family protein